MSHREHQEKAGQEALVVHVVVASTTRDLAQDKSGLLIADRLTSAGHVVGSREVVDDDVELIRTAVRAHVDRGAAAVIVTGGTGVSARDVTPEALGPLLRVRLDGFGELFRWLSFQEIGAAAMLSRAFAGVAGRTVVYALPGSSNACALAMDRLVLPEIRHLVHIART